MRGWSVSGFLPCWFPEHLLFDARVWLINSPPWASYCTLSLINPKRVGSHAWALISRWPLSGCLESFDEKLWPKADFARKSSLVLDWNCLPDEICDGGGFWALAGRGGIVCVCVWCVCVCGVCLKGS